MRVSTNTESALGVPDTRDPLVPVGAEGDGQTAVEPPAPLPPEPEVPVPEQPLTSPTSPPPIVATPDIAVSPPVITETPAPLPAPEPAGSAVPDVSIPPEGAGVPISVSHEEVSASMAGGTGPVNLEGAIGGDPNPPAQPADEKAGTAGMASSPVTAEPAPGPLPQEGSPGLEPTVPPAPITGTPDDEVTLPAETMSDEDRVGDIAKARQLLRKTYELIVADRQGLEEMDRALAEARIILDRLKLNTNTAEAQAGETQ